MNIQDMALDTTTQILLFTAGKQDRANGISMHDGWIALATELGLTITHTPARERYEDGWFSVTP